MSEVLSLGGRELHGRVVVATATFGAEIEVRGRIRETIYMFWELIVYGDVRSDQYF